MSATAFQRMRRERAAREAAENKETGTPSTTAYSELSFPELRAAAKEREIEGYGKMTKEQLVEALSG